MNLSQINPAALRRMGIKARGTRKAKPISAERMIAVIAWQEFMSDNRPRYSAFVARRLDAGENLREHWAKKKLRKQQHRAWGSLAVQQMQLPPVKLPCVITFTRLSPRMLDEGDNLPNCFKHCRDQIAKDLGTHDGPSAPIQWRYEQAKAPARCFGFVVQWQPIEETK